MGATLAAPQAFNHRDPLLSPVLGSYEEAWAALDRLAKSPVAGEYAAALKASLSAVHSLVRAEAERCSGAALSTEAVLRLGSAETECALTLREGDLKIQGAPPHVVEKYLLMEASRSLFLVKRQASSGMLEPAKNLLARIEGKIISDFP